MEISAVYWEPKIKTYGFQSAGNLSLLDFTLSFKENADFGLNISELDNFGIDFDLVLAQNISDRMLRFCLIFPSKWEGLALEHIYTRTRVDNKESVDEVLLTVMRRPRTYTKEDIVEINCHGGPTALRKTLELALKCGARFAEPGEFTKRAFLNGRIDLAKAEAVLDIIRAKTDAALKLGLEQLSGGLSKRIKQIREELIDILAHIEAEIDFCEEDIKVNKSEAIKKKIVISFLSSMKQKSSANA